MLNNLIKMAKQEGMFDTAFLLAEKNNLCNELFNSLKGGYNISYEKLKELMFYKTHLTGIEYLDICYNLKCLFCNSKYLVALHLNNNTRLEDLYCNDNNIHVLSLKNNKNLKRLDCYNNLLIKIDLSENIKLTKLCCQNNLLHELDLTNNTNLVELYCNNNPKLSIVKLNKAVEGKFCIIKDSHTQVIYVE